MSFAEALNIVAWIVVALCASTVLGMGIEQERRDLCWLSLGLCGLVFVRSLVWCLS